MPKPPSTDFPLEWTKKNRSEATKHDPPYETVIEVLAEVPEVCDVDRVTVEGVEDADPYVIAMARYLGSLGRICTVITEDRHDRPAKMSLATACGVLAIPTVPLLAFLAREKIWKP